MKSGRKKRMRHLGSLFLAGALIAGCGGQTKRHSEFMDTIRQYNDGIRWNDAPLAASLIPLAEREDFLEERADFEDDLRVGDYEIQRVRWGAGRKRAEIDVRFTWHLDSKGIVNKSMTKQLWRRFGKSWLMVEESMIRGEPMPGVPEIDEGGEAGDKAPATEDKEVLYDDGETDGKPRDPPKTKGDSGSGPVPSHADRGR